MPENTPEPLIFAEGKEVTETINNSSGLSSAFDGKDYSLLRYPNDLGTNPELKNYVAFYVNVRKRDAAGAYEKRLGTVDVSESLKAQNRTVTTNTKNLQILATIGTGIALGKIIGGDSTLGQVGAGMALTAAGSTEIGKKLIEAVNKQMLSVVNSNADALQMVQLKKVIALHMSGKPSTTHKATYDDVDMGVLSGLLREGSSGNISDIASKLSNISFGSVQEFSDSVMSAIQTMGPSLGSVMFKNLQTTNAFGTGPAGENLSRSLAIATNPFREQLFRNMGFRTFGFDYVFLPKSKEEALRVKNIIDTFKYYMHPGLSANNPYWLTYPAEFNIKFFYKGKENPYLHKISNCVLTDLQVDFGSGEDFMTFKPDDDESNYGIPTEITMKLQFTELEILTRERVGQGY